MRPLPLRHLDENCEGMTYNELLDALPEAQRSYVMAYDGCARETCEKLGMNWFTVSKYSARRSIRRALTLRAAEEDLPDLIASRQERQIFWTDTMRNSIEVENQLKASQMLGKSEADFIDKKIIEGGERPIGHVVGHVDISERIKILEANAAIEATAKVIDEVTIEAMMDDDDDLDFLE